MKGRKTLFALAFFAVLVAAGLSAYSALAAAQMGWNGKDWNRRNLGNGMIGKDVLNIKDFDEGGMIGMMSAKMGRSDLGGSNWKYSGRSGAGMRAVHEQMEELFEKGSYDDIVKLRQKGCIMPMIDSPEDFELMKEHHEAMEELHDSDDFGCHMAR